MPAASSAPGARLYKPPPAPVVPPPADPNLALMQLIAQFQMPPPVQQPVQQAPMPFQPMQVMPDYGPEEMAYFDSLSSRLNNQYSEGLNDVAFQTGVLNTNANRQRGDLNQKFDQMRERLPGGFQRRGQMKSGVYQAGLGAYAQDRTNATTDFESNLQNQLGALNRTQQRLTSAYTSGSADVESQRAAKRHQAASIIRAVR